MLVIVNVMGKDKTELRPFEEGGWLLKLFQANMMERRSTAELL
jgi:hypothetical protein